MFAQYKALTIKTHNKSMKRKFPSTIIIALFATVFLVLTTAIQTFAQATGPGLTNGLCAYWPLDRITGCNTNKTPDLVNGYDMQPVFNGLNYTNFGVNTLYLTNDPVRGNAMFFPCQPNSFGVPQEPLGTLCSLLYKSVNTNDLVPINRHAPAPNTISFFEKVEGARAAMNGGANWARVWSESKYTADQANDIDIEINASSTVDFFVRQNGPGGGPQSLGNFSGGTHEDGNITAYDGNWHNITIVTVTNVGTTVTNAGVWNVYVDGVLDTAASGFAKPEGLWNLDCVSIGTFLRASTINWDYLTNAVISDLAEWSRALTTNEIQLYMAQAITNNFPPVSPLTISQYSTPLFYINQGGSITLSWNASSDVTGLTINNGVGSVMSETTCGSGSITVTPPAGITTYTITATRNAEPPVTASITVHAFNAPAGWIYIDGFDADSLGDLASQGNWTSLYSSPQSQGCDMPQVLQTVTGNQVLGLDGLTVFGDPVLTAAALGPNYVPAGQSNTLFFRFELDPSIQILDIANGSIIPDVVLSVGLSDKILRDPLDFAGTNSGPCITIYRSTFGDGGPIDLQAVYGADQPLGSGYSYIGDAINGNSAGLATGVVYNVWIDFQKITNDPVNNISSYYSVYLQTNNGPQVCLFQNKVSNEDTNSGSLNKVFIDEAPGISGGTNMVLLDDFYLSSSGYNHGTPVPAGSFVLGTPPAGPTSITITSVSKSGSSVTLNWSTVPSGSFSFTVWSRGSLNSGSWSTVQTGISANTVTLTGQTAGTTFYRVTSP